MSRITIADGNFWHEGQTWGETGEILVDTSAGHSAGERHGLSYLPTPHHIDIIMEAGGKVVGMESKTWSDLESSRTSGRLARQLRTLQDTVDIPVLLIRTDPLFTFVGGQEADFLEIARWQALGAFVLVAPRFDMYLAAALIKYRPILAGGRNALVAVARYESEPKERAPGWLLRRLPYIGPQLSQRLITRYGSTRAALLAPDSEWQEMRIPERVIEARRKALEE